MIRRRGQRGSAMVEFVLTGIPMVFIWISVVQMALGMWHYHTLQYAVKAAGAFVSRRGASWVNSGNPQPRIADAAAVLAYSAIGMPTSSISVTFTPESGSATTCTLNNCLTNTTVFPPLAASGVGSQFTIKANYQFNSAMAMVAPGGSGGAVRFKSANLPAFTRQVILF